MLMIYSSGLIAQTTYINRNIKGVIIDESNNETIPFVNIYNESQRKWYLARENGTFLIDVHVGDTLVMTSIGYLGKVIQITEDNIDDQLSVQLIPQHYDIDEVQVFAFKSYEDFQEAFKNLKLPETRIDIVRNQLQESCERYAEGAAENKYAEYKLEHPGLAITFGKSGTKEKELRAELRKKDEIQYIIDKKFNREIVNRLTHLEGNELTNFMGFCNFDMEYLHKATEYEIVEKIMQRYEAYKVLKDSTGASEQVENNGLNLT